MIVGMVSTRFAGTDGVSLEAAKVAAVVVEAGHQVVWFAGELGPGYQPGTEERAAHFRTEANRELQGACFGPTVRSPQTSELLGTRTAELKAALSRFVDDYDVDVLVPQNALAVPLQLPLGLALTELLLETGRRAMAHHHDFAWERARFDPNAVGDVLAAAFPPTANSLHHFVINSAAREELARRRGIAATLLPNVMDFEGGFAEGDASRFRGHVGLSDGDVVLLQPTRVIPRKQIEIAVELADALDDPSIKLVVTHAEGDEGDRYGGYLQRRAQRLGVELIRTEVGGPEQPSLADAYAAADLVTFPSAIEGFGNALLEAFFYRRPVLVNRYPVYVRDIAPTGVRCLELDGLLTPAAVNQTAAWLGDPSAWQEAVEVNYEVGRRHFSYRVLRERFLPALEVP